MIFRIIVNKRNSFKHAIENNLKELHVSSTLLIEGDNNVKEIALTDGRKAFFVGNLVGIRSSQDTINPCPSSSELEQFIRTNSIENCQDKMEGRFLLTIIGPNDECCICADRFGQCDLYYQTNEQNTVFATNISLLPIPPTQNGFDQVGLVHSLSVYGFRPPKHHTFYENVHRLGVREIVIVKGEKIEFWEVAFNPLQTAAYGQQELNQYSDLLLDAIRIRGSEHGNIVYLSSGWDSTCILACLVHIFGANKVRAVIVRMLNSERSGVMNEFEIDRAQAIADYYGIHLDILDSDLRYQIPVQIETYRSILRSHSIAGATAITHGLLAEYVAKTANGPEAVFAGEISDGAHNLGFSQFLTIFHPVLSFREYSDKMASYLFGPTFLGLMQSGEFINDPIYTFLCGRFKDSVFDKLVDEVPAGRTQQLLASFFLRSNRLPLWSLHNSRLLTKEGIENYTQAMESMYLKQAAEVATQKTLYSWYLHLYNSFHWQVSTVQTFPVLAEANGFNLSMPFWDSRIQEFLSAMPEEWGRGLDLNPTKYPLKWMLSNRIDYPIYLQIGPHSYQYDVDPSVTPAGEAMYASAFTPYFRKRLAARFYREVLSPEIFDLDYIDSIADDYTTGKEVLGTAFSDLTSVCWHSIVGWYES